MPNIIHAFLIRNNIKMVPRQILLITIQIATVVLVYGQKANGTDSSKNDTTECDETFPWNSVRLPLTYTPLVYTLILHPNVSTGHFNGTLKIDIQVSNDTNASDWMILHAKDLDIRDVNVSYSIERIIMKKCHKFGQIALKLPTRKLKHVNFSIVLRFLGNATDDLEGLYVGSYMDEYSKRTKKMLITQFEPDYARHMLPCFDEPQFKAIFKVSIIREPQYIALSNGPLISTVPIPGQNLVIDVFGPTPKMSTYLLAIAVCQYHHISQNVTDNLTVSVYMPEFQIPHAAWALNVSVRAIKYLENFFGIPYPLPKVDLISISDFQSGAMENWGLITFRDSYLVYEESKTSLYAKELMSTVIVHELSHQWFGNLVTMKWWDDLWLNEGFADFFEIFATSSLHPDWNLFSGFVSSSLESALRLDGLNHTHPISNSILNPTELQSTFDIITYEKGSSLLRSLFNIVGADAFKESIKIYLSKFQYANADKNDLYTVLNKNLPEERSGVSLVDYMDSFTDQSGYPLIEAYVEAGKLHLNQSRFYYVNYMAENYSINTSLWFVPLTIAFSGSSLVLMHWMKKERKVEIDISTLGNNFTWYYINVNRTAFYRMNYEERNWLALFDELKRTPETFSPQDRAGFLSDAFALVQNGKMLIKHLLDLWPDFMRKATSRGTWKIFRQQVIYMDFNLRNSAAYTAFNKYMAALMTPVYKIFNWDFKPTSHESTMVHDTVLPLACYFNVSDCRNVAVQKFRQHIFYNATLKSDHRLLCCSSAMKTDPQTFFNTVLNRYNASEVPDEKYDYLACLAKASIKSYITRALNLALDSNTVKTSRVPLVFVIAAGNKDIGADFTWQFFEENFRKIKKHVQMLTLGRIIKGFDVFNSKTSYDKMTKLLDTQNLEYAKDDYERLKEKIQLNIQFLAINEKPIIEFLNDKGYI